jgi:glucans biosynthesis protein C
MKRIYYIDWLRILAIIAVFFFHSSHFFDPFYWHVKNPQQSNSVLIFLAFLNIWIMPLFFFLSGASTIFGIQKPFKSYVTGKTTRLLIPFIMGVLLLIPPQKYVEALSHHTFTGGYFEFLKEYFTGGMFNYQIGINPLWIGVLSYHLWFLGHLLIISVAFFPLIRLIISKGELILNGISKATSFTGGALLMFIPIAIVRVILKRHFPDYTGWCDLTMYSLYFLWGFIYTRHEGLKQTIIKSRYVGLITGVVLFVSYILSFSMKETPFGELFQNYKVYGYYVFQEAGGALATWSWIVFIMAIGIKYLNHESKYRKPLNEAVLPFYILHQTVLLLIGYVVVQWSWGSWGKFGFIAGSSIFIIFAIYILGVRPFNLIRYLFGMGKKQQE